MKNKFIALIAVAAALAVGCFAAACGDKNEDTPPAEVLPIAVEGAVKNFSLDLYGTKTKTLGVADYIDENGAVGVSYTAVSSDGDVLAVSEYSDGSFTVTALAVGTESVTLNAVMNGQTKLSVEVGFTVTDGTPDVEVLPIAVENAVKSFSLDLYGTDTKELEVADYIDENGAVGVSYTAQSSDGDVLAVSEYSDGSFTVVALGVGTESVTLNAVMNGQTKLSVSVEFTVTDGAPSAPVLEKEKYAYDKNAGGIFELPIELNGSEIAFIRKDGVRLDESVWHYDGETGCVVVAEELCLELTLGGYEMEVVTTGGTASFTLDITNTVKTAFDAVREKTATLGKTASVHFDVDFGGTSVKKFTLGNVELGENDYSVTASGIDVLPHAFSRGYLGDDVHYRLTLTNNDIYEFDITANNSLLFTDYDAVTVHSDIVSEVGVNPLYQDSTRVEVAEAPEDSGMTGRALLFTPHTTDRPLDVHGIYTVQHLGADSTWTKLGFKNGVKYRVAFDYMTVGTTAGEDISFRSWTDSLHCALDTGKPGVLQHFEAVITYDSARDVGLFVFGKLVRGGKIWFDNYSIVELENMPTLSADEYGASGVYEVSVQANGWLLDDVLIDGKPIAFTQTDGKIVIAEEDMLKLDFGTHTFSFVNPIFKADVSFVSVDRRTKAALTEKSKTLVGGETSVKLAGEFTNGVTVSKLMRQGTFATDNSSATPQEISTAGVAVSADGLTVNRSVLDLVYGTTTFIVEFSNGARETFTVSAPTVAYYNDFDDCNTWSDALAEHTDMISIVSGVEGFTGNVLKIDASKRPSTDIGGGWFSGVFCLHNGEDDSRWTKIIFDADKYYNFSFDYRAEMNGATHGGLGYHYINHYQNGEVGKIGNYEDGNKHRFSVTMRGSEFTEFAVRLDPREGDSNSVLYIDNFRIEKTSEIMYCDFDDSNIWSSKYAEGEGTWSVVNGIDGMTGNVLRYFAGGATDAFFNNGWTRIFCFANEKVEGADKNWQSKNLDANKYYTFSLKYKAEMNGAAHTKCGYNLDFMNGVMPHRFTLPDYADGNVHSYSFTVKGDAFSNFALGLDSAEGDKASVLYIDEFRITESAAKPDDYSWLYKRTEIIPENGDSVKFTGEFGSAVAVTSITCGDSALETSLLTVAPDGVTLAKAAWGSVTENKSYKITFSNGVTETLSLTTSVLFYCDFDENNSWDNKLTEDSGVVEIVSGIDGMTGSALKLETKNWVQHHPDTWFTRIFCFTKNGHDGTWQSLYFDEEKYYEFSFDYKVEMNGVTHTLLGYYYNFFFNGAHETKIDDNFAYADGGVHRFTVTVKGSAFTEFCIGLDPRENDLSSVMYIDNFRIKATEAPGN